MEYIRPEDYTDLNEVRKRLTYLHKLARETEWRSTAYRAKVEIIELKARRKELRKQAK
jgi:hypothetical protein